MLQINMEFTAANFKGFMSDNAYLFASAFIVIGITWVLWKRSKRKPKRISGKDYPENTVILHYGGEALRGRYAPYLGHFVMKLATYMKIAGIPYQAFPHQIPSPKQKVPWIEYNGSAMGDSQFIINFLNKEFSVDLNRNLSPHQKAIAWGIQKWLEEFTYWLNVQIRWVYLIDQFVTGDYLGRFWRKRFIKTFMRRRARKMLYFVGIGRHGEQEVYDMIKHDLAQLSTILGDKKYLMGDEPTQVDCSAFGILCQIRYETPESCPGKQLLNNSEEVRNLRDYIDRIKENFWPDWEELLLKE